MSAEEWNDCLVSSEEENPFLLHQFLNALEQSGSAVDNSMMVTLSELFSVRVALPDGCHIT